VAHRKVRAEPGGIESLGRILSHHWGPLEADFVRYYQLDLRHACFGRRQIGARRLGVLIGGLPVDSAFMRSYLHHRTRPVLPPPPQPRRTSSPEQIRRAGGRFVYAPKKEVTA